MLRLIAVLALAGTARAVPVPYRKSRAKAATARYDRGSEGDRSPAHDRHAKVTDQVRTGGSSARPRRGCFEWPLLRLLRLLPPVAPG